MLQYRYRAGSDASSPDAAANCIIPNTPEAVAFMDRQLTHGRVRHEHPNAAAASTLHSPANASSAQDAPIGGYQLPTVYVYAQYTYSYAGTYQSGGGCVNYSNCYDMSVDDGGGGQSWDAGEPEVVEERSDERVDCSVPHSAGSGAAAYCLNILPTATQDEKIWRAIDKMKAKGGVCADIADFATKLMFTGEFRMSDPAIYPFSGVALGSSGDGGIVIATSYVDTYVDAEHNTGETPPRDLSTEIDHEVDHLLFNLNHNSVGTAARPQTDHMYTCSDLSS